jgi:hypothetical protein
MDLRNHETRSPELGVPPVELVSPPLCVLCVLVVKSY